VCDTYGYYSIAGKERAMATKESYPVFNLVFYTVLAVSAYSIYSTYTSKNQSTPKPQQVAEKTVPLKQSATPSIDELERKRKGFHCLSSWDGSHKGVVKWVKRNLRDPDSYKHVETRITPVKDVAHVLVMEYRARNGFGGYTSGGVIAEVDNNSCKATITSSL
jgi:hypothetical protein